MVNYNSRLIWLFLLILGLSTTWRLLRPGFFSMQDDMQVFRLQQLDQCLGDGQIPCRYIRDGGLGYGYPLYDFYPPLPYYTAEIFHLAGFSYIDSLKIVYIIPGFIRPLGMFLLAASIFPLAPALLSSTLYTLAPYLAVDGYVRGALGEYWALSLAPLILYFLSQNRSLGLILSLAALFLSHNLTGLYFIPFLFLFSLINKKLIFYLKNLLVSICLSAFFLLPAFFEKQFTTVSTMTEGYFNFVNHFTTLRQLFISRFWGYGASLWGPVDDMSFQIGYLHWLLPLISTVLVFQKKFHKIHLLLLSVAAISLFLTHNKSTFIWQAIPLLPYYQFPWRFLGLAVFCLSLAAGYVYQLISKKFYTPATIILIALTFILNINYFREDIWFPTLTDAGRLTPAEIFRQSGAGLRDYWPKFSQKFPETMAPESPVVEAGTVITSAYFKTSRRLQYHFRITSDHAAIKLPLVYFPIWQQYLNDVPAPVKIDPEFGQIRLDLPQGDYRLLLLYKNTPLRTAANLISLSAIIYLIYVSRRVKK